MTDRRHNGVRGERNSGVPARWPAMIFFIALWCGFVPAYSARADGGDVNNPDMQVNGFALFGTNAAGASSVTSGWGSVYIQRSAEVGSNLVVHGSISSGDTIQMNRYRLDKTVQVLTGLAAIQPTNSYIQVQGNMGNVDILADPQIAPGLPGQLLTLQGTANDRLVKIDDGAGVQTQMDQPFSLGLYDIIQLIYDNVSSNWVEINRSNNRSSN